LSSSSSDRQERFLRHLEPLRAALQAFARRSLRDPSAALDVLQTVVGNAYRDFDLYAEGTSFRAWMFRFVSHEVSNRNRLAARRREVGLTADVEKMAAASGVEQLADFLDRLLDEPEAVLDHCDDAIAGAFGGMSDQERKVLLLRAIGEFKYREIAEILDVPVGTVMGLLSRGRQKLRLRLIEYGREHRLLPPHESA
jgi:RNA polymerase sigma-70 factor (ECF subfamily)